jgi:hypothetical protein
MQGYADNFIFVIPVEYPEHTKEQPFCWDSACPCHEIEDFIATVAKQVQDGVFTPQEATDFRKGKGI